MIGAAEPAGKEPDATEHHDGRSFGPKPKEYPGETVKVRASEQPSHERAGLPAELTQRRE